MSQPLVAPGERYAESALDIIDQSAILTKKDLGVITELKEELADARAGDVTGGAKTW